MDMLEIIKHDQQRGRVGDELGAWLMEVAGAVCGHPRFRNYPEIEDWQSEAVTRMLAGVPSYDATFAGAQPRKYFSTIAYNTILNCIRRRSRSPNLTTVQDLGALASGDQVAVDIDPHRFHKLDAISRRSISEIPVGMLGLYRSKKTNEVWVVGRFAEVEWAN